MCSFLRSHCIRSQNVPCALRTDRDTGTTTQRIRAISALGGGTLYMNGSSELNHLQPVDQGLRLHYRSHAVRSFIYHVYTVLVLYEVEYEFILHVLYWYDHVSCLRYPLMPVVQPQIFVRRIAHSLQKLM